MGYNKFGYFIYKNTLRTSRIAREKSIRYRYFRYLFDDASNVAAQKDGNVIGN